MAEQKKGLSKGRKTAIISLAITAVFFIAVMILNIFIPVRYISAYTVSKRQVNEGELCVRYIDVGYGDSAIVVLPDGKSMLIDGGDGSYSHTLKILSELNSFGIDTIDYLVCTSVRSEHCGGLTEILQYKKVNKAYIPYVKNTYITQAYGNFYAALGSTETQYSCFGEGECGEDYFFTFLSPSALSNPEGEYAALNKTASDENINSASAVLWLEYGETSFVFTSDSSSKSLKRITDEYLNCLALGQDFCPIGSNSVRLEDCDVVTVAGHGGAANTYAAWYAALEPEQAVISVGENYSGCPSAQALADVCNFVSQPLLTSERGTIEFFVTADGYNVVD
ncbi:MAG: ComEC/Rec2 family competence protein [Candidatus Coproplasma sp.]